MDELSVISRARRLVADVKAPPVDVLALAAAHGMQVRESEDLARDEAGRTWKIADRTFIVVNKNDDPYRQRFTILHELAHHVLELPSKHGEKIPASELERFSGRPVEEKLCDAFAAACLVPAHLLRPLTESCEFSADQVRELSTRFQASKPCVASSFVRTSSLPLAYVFAEAGRIQLALTSSALRTRGIYIDSPNLPRTSAASIALERGLAAHAIDLDGVDWSASDRAMDCAIHEEAICLGAFRQTLSLLTFEFVGRASGADTANDADEDELLPELTGILPWPKR